MNKQKAIEILRNADTLTIQDTRTSNLVDMVIKSDVIATIELIDETQKPVIPQFVADWIDACKENSAIGLYIAMNPDFLKQWNKSDELISWSRKTSNQDIFARAWLDGYEVEQEKRYKVVMPNVASSGGVLTRIKHDDSWIWIDTLGTIVEGRTHTRKELEEAGFGWVFSCDGVEVEEVKDEI